jgi:hypothetical protein
MDSLLRWVFVFSVFCGSFLGHDRSIDGCRVLQQYAVRLRKSRLGCHFCNYCSYLHISISSFLIFLSLPMDVHKRLSDPISCPSFVNA